jgi:hypothetical protein
MAEQSKSKDQSMESGFHSPKSQFYSELIRIVTGMYVGVLALMTFLLTVGFQRPHDNFKYALYTTITVLTLNLLAYLAGHMFFLKHMTTPKDAIAEDKKDKDKDNQSDSAKSVSAWEKSRRQLRVMRLIQQVLFVLAVLSVAWLAIATAQFFFTIPTSQTGGGAAPQ